MSAKCTIPGDEVTRNASRRKAAFLALRSTRCTLAPGVSASAQARTTPGNPPPLPRSIHALADGASVRSCNESEMWRVQRLGSVDGATRLVFACHSVSSSTKRSSRVSVSRETGVRARAAALSDGDGEALCLMALVMSVALGASSLRANGSRESAPDDRLRKANPAGIPKTEFCFVVSRLAMTALKLLQNGVRALTVVSRETNLGRRLRGPAPSFATQIGRQDSKSGRRHSLEPSGLPHGPRPRGVELSANFIGKPGHPTVVDIAQDESLVAPEGVDVSGLALQVNIVFGVNFEMGRDD